MLQNRLHHTKFPVLRRCYERTFAAREIQNLGTIHNLPPDKLRELTKLRAGANNDKMALSRIGHNTAPLEEVNKALDHLLSLPRTDALALIDKWQAQARETGDVPRFGKVTA